MLLPNSVDVDNGVYGTIFINEAQLFTLGHIDQISEHVNGLKTQLNGIYFIVQSDVEQGKQYKLFVPIEHVLDSYKSRETMAIYVKSILVDLTDQLKQHNVVH